MKKENQRKFIQDLSVKLNIKHPSDWGRVTKKQIVANDGASFINIFDGSVKRAITTVLEGVVFFFASHL